MLGEKTQRGAGRYATDRGGGVEGGGNIRDAAAPCKPADDGRVQMDNVRQRADARLGRVVDVSGDSRERVGDVIDHPAVLAQILAAAGQELRLLRRSGAGESVGFDAVSLDPAEDLRRGAEEDATAASNEE